MKAVTWQGPRDMRVEDVPDAQIVDPTDAVIRVTSSGLCDSDLHLYEPLAAFMTPGDVVGHEPMGVVVEVGSEVRDLRVGDRVVVPFNISCGSCWMCSRGLHSQCETTQNRDQGTGASLLGYGSLYGQVAGGQAEFLRVQFADFLPIKVPEGPSADRVPERLARVRGLGAETIDIDAVDDLAEEVRSLTAGRGADSVAQPLMMKAGFDRLAALHGAIDAVRRGGTVSISGVYGGAADRMPMMQMFDKQLQLRMGQANVRRWSDDILPLLLDDSDPLGTETFATHRLPLADAPSAYASFRDKADGMIKVVFTP